MTTPRRQPATGQRRRRTRTGADLSMDAYLDAAVNLIEKRGASFLSARTLGAAVGADATALYRYFSGIDEVLRAVADRMIGIVLDRWTPDPDWIVALTELARELYHVYAVEFPRSGLSLAPRTTGLPNEIRAVEVTIGLLRDGGFDEETAAHMFRLMSDFLLGHAMLEGAFIALPEEVQAGDNAFWEDLPERVSGSGGAPHVQAAAPHLRETMVQSSFEASLQLVMRGVAATPRRMPTEG